MLTGLDITIITFFVTCFFYFIWLLAEQKAHEMKMRKIRK